MALHTWKPLSYRGPVFVALMREAIWYASGRNFQEGTAASVAASAALMPASAPSANHSWHRRKTAAVSCASPASRHLRACRSAARPLRSILTESFAAQPYTPKPCIMRVRAQRGPQLTQAGKRPPCHTRRPPAGILHAEAPLAHSIRIHTAT